MGDEALRQSWRSVTFNHARCGRFFFRHTPARPMSQPKTPAEDQVAAALQRRPLALLMNRAPKAKEAGGQVVGVQPPVVFEDTPVVQQKIDGEPRL